MEEKSEWEINWQDEDETRIHFRQIRDADGKVVREFSLSPPEHAKLYYALMDWFMDDLRKDIPRPNLDMP